MGLTEWANQPNNRPVKTFTSFYDAAFDELHERGGGKIVCTFADGATSTFERDPVPDSKPDPNAKPLRPEDLIEPKMSEPRPIIRAIILIAKARAEISPLLNTDPCEPETERALTWLAEAEKLLLDQDARTGTQEAPPST